MALVREEDATRGSAEGAVDYLSSPFSPGALPARRAVHLARASLELAPDPLALPEQGGLAFGRYLIVRELGRGGYGRVYLANDRRNADARVALKVLVAPWNEREESRIRFIREAYTLASLADPHVVRVFDGGTEGRWTYLAMEHVEGESLSERVKARGPIGEGDVRALARGILLALVSLERAGVVHRDIKPQNLILRANRIAAPVLIDFGLARNPHDRGITERDVIVGTPAYMPPEAWRRESVDNRSDLYNVGLTLRFALVAEEIYPALEGIELLRAVAAGPLPRPPVPLSQGFLSFLERLTDPEPLLRPQTAARALEILGRLPLEQGRVTRR
jgi:serine/threonine protein kinase